MSDTFEADLRAFHAARRNGDDVMEAARALLNVAKQSDDLRMAIAYGCLGQAQRDAGYAETAADSYRRSAQCYQRQRKDNARAHALRHEGDCFMEAGRPDLAEAPYREAIRFYDSLREAAPLGRANAERSFALFFENRGDKESAIEFWHAALKGYIISDCAEGIDECETALGKLGASIDGDG